MSSSPSPDAADAGGGGPPTGQPPQGPPYAPRNALLGGLPTKDLDDTITVMFLMLFVLGAITHMTILQLNLRLGRKFLMSGLIFGFCMARIAACTLRLVWASYPSNIPVAIAANIFVQAGVIILFVINLVFVQRILRASYPQWAWKKWLSLLFKAYFATIVIVLIIIITVTVQSFYTLSTNTRRIDRVIQLFAGTYFAVAAFLPLPILLLKLLVPKEGRVEKFGEGRFRTKIWVLVFASAILTVGAGFRTVTNYFAPRPRTDPAWYHSKACFYSFNFAIEIIVVGLYAAVRVDKRFFVPNGSHGPGDYLRSDDCVNEKKDGPPRGTLCDSEEQVFHDAPAARLSDEEHILDTDKDPKASKSSRATRASYMSSGMNTLYEPDKQELPNSPPQDAFENFEKKQRKSLRASRINPGMETVFDEDVPTSASTTAAGSSTGSPIETLPVIHRSSFVEEMREHAM
ncbi:hypothetical protein HYFRA_00005231 [Hymenoscyphus fraxineus]|uniref:Uncharacterized protein n=1 Tax=Hymenoscyphus fraxineus TaxID=746836 RepID=A0A9N9PW81_9HELO|nr:hypothetical protein HYFRA_00005231 [Hymenoscyphus fraxineus]